MASDSPKMVRYFDPENRQIIDIPASELAPGVVQVQIDGEDGLVWTDPSVFKRGTIKLPPFDQNVRDSIRIIQTTFAEHNDTSLEEWEEGFRRDSDPAGEIALWLHAVEVFNEFTCTEASFERRNDIYRCIVTCLISSPDNIRHVLESSSLTQDEEERIINRVYGSESN